MFDQLVREFRSGKLKSVYFITGDENYQIDKLIKLAETNVIPDTEKDFNLQVFYGKDSSARQVVEACRERPFVGNFKLVIVKEGQEIRNWEDIIPYIKNPPEYSSLIISYKQKKPDGRSAWVKSIKEQAVYFESKSLFDYQLPAFIKDLAHGMKINLDQDAISLLAEYVGNNLSHIENELEKLKLVSQAKDKIGADIIAQYIGISRENNVFELCKAFSQNDKHLVYSIMYNIASNMKANPLIPMISSLFNHFQKIWMCKHYHKKSDAELISILKLSFASYLQAYKSAASRYSFESLNSIFELFKEYDFKSKGINSGSSDQGEIFKEFVIKLNQI